MPSRTPRATAFTSSPFTGTVTSLRLHLRLRLCLCTFTPKNPNQLWCKPRPSASSLVLIPHPPLLVRFNHPISSLSVIDKQLEGWWVSTHLSSSLHSLLFASLSSKVSHLLTASALPLRNCNALCQKPTPIPHRPFSTSSAPRPSLLPFFLSQPLIPSAHISLLLREGYSRSNLPVHCVLGDVGAALLILLKPG